MRSALGFLCAIALLALGAPTVLGDDVPTMIDEFFARLEEGKAAESWLCYGFSYDDDLDEELKQAGREAVLEGGD